MKFFERFGNRKPVMGMLHLKANAEADMLTRAMEETRIYMECGVDALLVENYFGSTADCETVLAWLQAKHPNAVYGVNILGDYRKAFELSNRYGAKFIQIDSVCGHLCPEDDEAYALNLARMRRDCDAVVLGGVRFKYQPVKSGRTLEEDLQLGMQRCDAIVVTGEGTGMATPQQKVAQFREILGDFPLIVGAGVTMDTIAESFAASDGAIVGSYFKEGHRDYGDVCAAHVREFIRKKQAVMNGGI